MTEFQQRAEFVREALAKAVADALERKRRLGHYAVIWQDGKPYCLPPEERPAEEKVR